jgi:hypothetical protein
MILKNEKIYVTRETIQLVQTHHVKRKKMVCIRMKILISSRINYTQQARDGMGQEFRELTPN